MIEKPLSRLHFRDCMILAGVGLLMRLFLLVAFPEPYGNDAVGRLYFKDSLFLSHWLPLTQALVWVLTRLSDDVFWLRLFFAAVGAASAAVFYIFLLTVSGRRAALFGGILFSFSGLYVYLSLMPYQGPLFLGLYYGALILLFSGPRFHSVAGSILFGLAALTRYEAWFVIPLLGLWRLHPNLQRGSVFRAVGAAAGTLLYFGWAPLAWLGLSTLRWGAPSGFLFQGPGQTFYGWHPHFDLSWAAAYAGRTVMWLVGFGSPLVVLAAWGGARLARGGPVPDRLRLLLANTALVLGFFFFIIGREQETVFRFVLFPLSTVLTLTALGAEPLLNRLSRRHRLLPAWLTALVALVLAVAAGVRLQRVTAEPRHSTPYQVAQFLEGRLGPARRAVILAAGSSDPAEAAPMDCQRVLAISGAMRSYISCAALLSESEARRFPPEGRAARLAYVVRFRNFQPESGFERRLLEAISGSGVSRVLDTPLADVWKLQASD